MSEPKSVYRYPPCPDHDVEAMESWLSDMAAKGLVLTRDGFFFGFGIFEKTEPKTMRYRLEAAKYTSSTLNEFMPEEEAQELYEAMGWRYVAARGNFHIYCTDDPKARELHTDPQVQAITLGAVRKRIIRDIVIEFIWILLFCGLRVGFGTWTLRGGPLVLAIIAIGTPAALLFFVLIIWSVADLFRGLRQLNRLRQKMKSGDGLDHDKDWRRGRPRYILGIIVNLLMTLVFFGLIFSSCLKSVDNKNEIPLDEFTGSVPFATMVDFVPGGSFEPDKTSLGYRLNTVEIRSDLLAPVIIEYGENGDIDTADGLHISGGLDITYIEARTEWLAKEMFREFRNDGRTSSHYAPLELSLKGMDQCEAFMDIFPTVILRKGSTVLRAEFYYTSDVDLSVEQWAGVIAESIS